MGHNKYTHIRRSDHRECDHRFLAVLATQTHLLAAFGIMESHGVQEVAQR